MHMDIEKTEARERVDRAAGAGGHPARPRPGRLLPARVLGRHAPAGDDRAGAVVRPQAADRRRAHHRARRDDPGADPGPDPRAARRDRRRGDPGHPRPGRRGRHRRPRGRDVRRADRGAGHARRDLLRPPAPLHLGAAGLDRPRRPRPPRAAAGHRGPAALAGQPAAGLPLRAPLPARVRQVRPDARPGTPGRRVGGPRGSVLARRGRQAQAARGRRPRSGSRLRSGWRERGQRRRAAARGRPPAPALPRAGGDRLPPRGGQRQGGRRRQLRAPRGRDRGAGGGVGLREDHAGADADAAAASHRRADPLRRPRHHRRRPQGPAAAATGHADGLPGPVRLAEPAQDRAPAGVRAAAAARQLAGGGRGHGSTTCSSAWAWRPSTRAGSRTSSPAVSASASASRALSRSSRG